MQANNHAFDWQISSLQEFITMHTGTMNCLFLLLYAFEQALLVIFAAIYPFQIMFIISLFVIFAFLTFGIEKVTLESRNKYLEKELSKLKNERKMVLETAAAYMPLVKNAVYEIKRKETEKLKKGKSLNKKVKEND
ncbi:MAG: hypothetical protein PHO02_01180 [Candidatus Nanoarchaeia archaeon]|nr:hypothetical protein [Candidatus Nanoarchaeia archaeon]